ncbi:MAG: Stp1/IreP family PP2C-type Ser/Thr phosphatase [Bacteriovoracaceae bacterium]
MTIISAGATDIGRKRKTNQDAIFLSDELQFYLVADGMGGHSGGDIASALTVELMPEYLSKHITNEPKELLRNAALHVNRGIFRKAYDTPQLKGMGTTLVTHFFKDGSLFVSNVGDSRSYMINNRLLFQMSRDHSLVQEKLNMGLYNRDQAKQDKQKNVLIRSVGFEENVEVDVFSYKFAKNDIFLLCSDGLHGRVSDHDMITIINKHTPDLEKVQAQDLNNTVTELIALANQNGGNDNISVVIAMVK